MNKLKVMMLILGLGLAACSEEDRTIKVEHEGVIDIKAAKEEKEKYRKLAEDSKAKLAEIDAKRAERRAKIAAERAAQKAAAEGK